MGLIHLGAVVLLRLSWVILRLRVEEDHDYDGEAKIQQKHHELESIHNGAQVLSTWIQWVLLVVVQPCVRYPGRSILT